jgi:hypothetical protein
MVQGSAEVSHSWMAWRSRFPFAALHQQATQKNAAPVVNEGDL